MDNNLIHYTIVRRDLPLGVMAAMVAHAAGESAALYDFEGGFPGSVAVILEAKNEAHLLQIREELKYKGVAHVKIMEPSAPYNGQMMAVGVVPDDRTRLSPLMEPYQVLKKLEFESPTLTSDECSCSNCRAD